MAPQESEQADIGTRFQCFVLKDRDLMERELSDSADKEPSSMLIRMRRQVPSSRLATRSSMSAPSAPHLSRSSRSHARRSSRASPAYTIYVDKDEKAQINADVFALAPRLDLSRPAPSVSQCLPGAAQQDLPAIDSVKTVLTQLSISCRPPQRRVDRPSASNSHSSRPVHPADVTRGAEIASSVRFGRQIGPFPFFEVFILLCKCLSAS